MIRQALWDWLRIGGRAIGWVVLLLGLPWYVERLAAAHLTPSEWGRWALVAMLLYFTGRVIRWAFRVARPTPSDITTTGVARVRAAGEADISNDTAIARHEAAHAVVAHGLGARVNLVSIVPDSRSGGRNRVDFDTCGALTAADALFNLMAVSVASVLVERDHLVAAGHYDVGPDEDVTRTVAAAARIIALGSAPTGYEGLQSVDQLVAAAAERARGLLATQTAAVDAVTTALLAERTLDADRVVQLIELGRA